MTRAVNRSLRSGEPQAYSSSVRSERAYANGAYMKWISRTACALALLSAAPVAAQEDDAGGAVQGSAAASSDSDLAAEGESAVDGEEVAGTGLTLAERIRAVSRPVFRKQGRFELAPLAGVSVSDSFFRRWTVGTRASYHLVDSFSIDVGGAWNAWSEPLEAAVFIGTPEAVVVNDPSPLLGYADAGVTFDPFYGKVALMSEWIVHFDTYLSAGGGAMFTATPSVVHPALEVGGGARVFLTPWLAVRADLRDYFYPADFGDGVRLQSLFLVTLGVGFYFPFTFDDDQDVVKIAG